MAKTSLNDIRARLQVIAGHAASLDAMLKSDDCPQDRWGMIDFCTASVLQQMRRLNHVLAQGGKQETPDAT